MRVFAAALLGLIAAFPASAEQAFEYKRLGDTAWTATEWNGAAPKPPAVLTLAFAPNNRFSAHAGCNRYTGRYSVAGERITFTAEGSTKMACHGARGETDTRMLADLKRIARLSLTPDGALLVAHGADGASIMKTRCTKNC
jgi:heat shock protein HslJ